MANQYVFLPWLRRGLAMHIAEQDPLLNAPVPASRPRLNISLKLMGDDLEKKSVPQDIHLLGPGDITGIERAAIVKTEPASGVNNFEPNYFPYIEFYEEDFLWRYTPAKAMNESRLRPWVALLVLQEEEFQRKLNIVSTARNSISISSELIAQVMPLPEQSWAWAHVQVNDANLTTSDVTAAQVRNEKLAAVLNQNPNLGVCRLLCPRRLKPFTKYTAFVVPLFERGRLAGLGEEKNKIESAGRFQPAWDINQENNLELPVYYEWQFQTGEEDFEALAKKITPRDLTGTDVGKLWMDARDINYGDLFDYKGNLEPSNPDRSGFLPFEGALRLPGTPSPPLTNRNGQPEKDFVKAFAGLVNLGVQYRSKLKSELTWSAAVPGNNEDDPMLVPPVYGRWYARQDGDATVDPVKASNWLEQLNLDPAFRVAASLGADVVKEHQEEYVSRAWEQLADNRRQLNQEMQRLSFAKEVAMATFKKHFTQSSDTQGEGGNKLLALTQSLHSVVRSDVAGLSVAGKLIDSKADAVFTQPTFRRLTRTHGPVIKKVQKANVYKTVLMSGAVPLSIIGMVVQLNPPFQNFNGNDKLIKVDPNSFIAIGPATQFYNLQVPNWFPITFQVAEGISFTGVTTRSTLTGFATTVGFLQTIPVERGKISGIFKDLLEKVMRKPLIAGAATTDLKMMSEKVKSKITPSSSFKALYKAKIPVTAPPAVSETEVISPNSFNPSFKDAVYDRLSKLRPELFIPNLEQVKPESFVLLQANSAFIESFLLGMNHELAAEFLWRGYPADMNATFFRQFWDKSDGAPSGNDQSDIKPIRQWLPAASLGKNAPAGAFENPLVFVIRAELVKKYPNLVVYARKAKFINGGKNRVPDTNSTALSPIFLAGLAPDYLFAGFALNKNQVLGNTTVEADKAGYYFVIAERPGEVHFGMDQTRKEGVSFKTWNDLAWTDIPSVNGLINLQKDIPADPQSPNGLVWGKGQKPISADPAAGAGDAAQMASILIQKPAQLFVHASLLVS